MLLATQVDLIQRISLLFFLLLTSAPVGAQDIDPEGRASAELPYGHIITRRDVRVGGSGGFVPGGENGVLSEATVTITVESEYLGPFSAQVGGAFGSSPGLDVAGLTIGVGLSTQGSGARTWVMVNGWEQLTGHSISHAASVSTGLQIPLADRFGVFGEGRAMIGDVRADDSTGGFVAWGIFGMSATL